MGIEDVIARCAGPVHLTVNDHLSMYTSVNGYFDEMRDRGDGGLPCDEEIARLAEGNALYELQCYDRTPVGSFTFFGASLDEVVTQALEAIPKRTA